MPCFLKKQALMFRTAKIVRSQPGVSQPWAGAAVVHAPTYVGAPVPRLVPTVLPSFCNRWYLVQHLVPTIAQRPHNDCTTSAQRVHKYCTWYERIVTQNVSKHTKTWSRIVQSLCNRWYQLGRRYLGNMGYPAPGVPRLTHASLRSHFCELERSRASRSPACRSPP